MITKNKMVSVSYVLRTEQNGELLEAAGADRPLDFICGQGQTLEYFEMNLLDKNEGDKFDFSIPAAHAYGLVNEDMIVDLPQEIFKDVEAEEMEALHSHKCGGCSGCGSEGGCGSHDEGCGCGGCH